MSLRAPERFSPTSQPIVGTVWPSPAHRRQLRVDVRSAVVGLILVAVSLAVGAITLTTGDFPMTLTEVWRTLTGSGNAMQDFVIGSLRLPRMLTALLIGASLGIGGALFQSMSRNALGSPDIIGFDTGAATGALVVILVSHGTSAQVSLGAIVGGLASAAVVYLLAIRRGLQGFRLILIGIGISAMLTAANTFLLTRAKLPDARSANAWLVGSLNGSGWAQVISVTIALVVLMPAALYLGRSLTFLELGDDAAAALGVPIERTRLGVMLVGVGLTAVATAAAGPIAFVALAAPQVVRRLTRATGPQLIPSALMGSTLLILSDLGAQRLFAPIQLPVGIMTAAVGGIYLAWLLTREWKKGRG